MANILLREDLQWLGEKFSPGMAWVDLQLLLSDGEKELSIRLLASRWRWSTNRVLRFVSKLEGLSLLRHQWRQGRRQERRQLYSLITSNYSDSGDTNGDTRGDIHRDTQEGTLDSPSLPFSPTPPISITPPIIPQEETKRAKTIEERAREFSDKVAEYKDKYPKRLLDDFASYWSEPNRSKTKLRYELEKTWDLSRRLAKWARNDYGKYGTSTVEDNPHTRGPKFSDPYSYLNEQGFPRNSRVVASQEERDALFNKALEEYYVWVEECKLWDQEHHER